MVIATNVIEGDIDNLNNKIVECLEKFGDFPEEVRVLDRVIYLNHKGLLSAKITSTRKEQFFAEC